MARQSSGVYQAPANTDAVPGQTISSSKINTETADLGNEITNSLDRQGRGAMQANLDFGGFKGVNAATPTASADLVTKGYADGAYESATATIPTSTLKANNSGAAAAASATVTITIASPGVVTWTAHGRAANDPVYFTTTGALPTNLTVDTIYYVVGASITTNTFQVSATEGGSAINTAGSQSGTHTGTAPASAAAQEVTFATLKKIMQQEPVNPQTGTSYTITFNDLYKLTTFSNSAATAVTLPQATGNFGANVWLDVKNDGAGLVTITPTTSTIDGASFLILPQGYGCRIVSDGTNYKIVGMNPTKGRVLLNTLTASSSASLTDTTSITTIFNYYEIVLDNMLPATNGADLYFRVHSGGSYQATTYLAAGHYTTTAGITAAVGSLTTAIICNGSGLVANSGNGLTGIITIFSPNSSARKSVFVETLATTSAGSNLTQTNVRGYWDGGTGVIDGFQLIESSGNIASGTAKIYGYN